jgi:predicted RNase H-like nuclease (RuvC/YqgF family)
MNLLKHKQDQLKYIETYREKAKKHQTAIENGKQARINVGQSVSCVCSHHQEETADDPCVSMSVEEEIQVLEQERAELERQVAQQNLSAEEVARMNSEKSTLSESIRELQAELNKKKRELGEQEIAVNRRMDEIDSLVLKYNHGKAVIGLNTDAVQQQYNIDFNIDVNMASSDLTAVNIVGQRIKESIRPGLQSFGEGLRVEEHEQSNMKIEMDDELDRLNSALEQRRHQVQTLEHKLRGLDNAAEIEKQVSITPPFLLEYVRLRLIGMNRNCKRKLKSLELASLNWKRTSRKCPCPATRN